MLIALSSTLYCAKRSSSKGQGSKNFESTCVTSAATVPRTIVARRGPLSLSLVSTCLQCHLLCLHSVFTFLLVDYVAVCYQSRLCTHLFPFSELSVRLRLAAGWSPVVISLSHHLLVASVGICCQSGLCTHLSLLSKIGVCLCLTVRSSFCSLFFIISFSCMDVCSRWSII